MKPDALTIQTIDREPRILTFKEFCHLEHSGMPKYNNLFAYFNTGWDSQLKQKTPHYRRFHSEHRDMDKRLRTEIQKRDESEGTSKSLKPFEGDLYEAYTIMRGYGVSDEDLFS